LDHILALQNIINIYLNNKRKLYCAFVDYQRAFDSINRVHLWTKLLSCGVKGKIFNIVYNLYKNAQSYVKVNNQQSDIFSCMVGVRQGENLSPLLFAIFLNDLHSYLNEYYNGLEYIHKLLCDHNLVQNSNELQKILLLLYADDTIVLAESAEELQKAMNGMYQYCTNWKLDININKTKIVVFSRGKIRNLPLITFGDTPLEVVFEYVYLGITFNYNGTFIKAIGKLYKSASKAMFSVIKKSRRLHLDFDTQLHLFDSMVVPIMLYGSEVWGYSDLKLLGKLQIKFCKIILNVKKSTPNNMVLGELGTFPLELAVHTRMVTFWCKLIQGYPFKISFNLYSLLCKLDNVSPWIKHLQTILNNCGLTWIWSSQALDINSDWLKEKIKQNYRDQFIQNWNSTISNSSKCNIYRLFKTEFRFEPYLNQLPFKLCNYLTKFRCRSTRIPVESGIFIGLERKDRLCKLCPLNVVGDEYHYIFECTLFTSERKQFLAEKYSKNPTIHKIKTLFNTSGMELINLCKFIKCIMHQFSA